MYYTECLVRTTVLDLMSLPQYRKTGLLFSSVDDATVERICLAPEIHTLFTTGYFVEVVEQGTLIYGYDSVLLPDKAKAATYAAPLWFCYVNTVQPVDLHAGYSNCLSLFKITGCADCPDNTYTCLHSILSTRGHGAPATYSAWTIDHVMRYRCLLVGHKYIAPSHTTIPTNNPNGNPYQETWRHYNLHDFTRVKQP